MELPLIDLSGMDSAAHGGAAWAAVRSQVMEALEAYNCFEAEYGAVGPELREALFDGAATELFRLPLETKTRNVVSGKPNHGYIGQVPGFPFESLSVAGADRLENVQQFASVMWPNGEGGITDQFCAAVWEFAWELAELEQMVRRMILEGLGVEKHYEALSASTEYGLRLSEYAAEAVAEERLGPHTDPNMVSIVCQHEIAGLEIRSNAGQWVRITPTPRSFTFLLGDAFEAWTNGRLRAATHRVVVTSKERRRCAILGSQPDDEFTVEAPPELDGDGGGHRRRLYLPYRYSDYLNFRFSAAGVAAEHVLSAFQESSGGDVVDGRLAGVLPAVEPPN